MLDFGFSEVLLISVLALVVLGPEKLPRLASQVGRWIGRARAMARQFREQLEEEVNVEDARRVREAKSADSATQAGVQSIGATAARDEVAAGQQEYESTFSHAHPTNEYGANPHTSNGAAESTPTPPSSEANVAAPQAQPTPSGEVYAPATPPTHTPADVAADPTTPTITGTHER
jgi:sec-independent protein translocase protein TatB